MISKVVCWGETRGEALLRMRRALEEYKIAGVKTNIPLHQKLLTSLRFQAGNFDTRFLEERFSMEGDQPPNSEIAAILATVVAHQRGQQAAQIVRRGDRDTSNWKWVGRYERMHR
jgi:acetyl/propionyl-CoA carboxylase alpha subunit